MKKEKLVTLEKALKEIYYQHKGKLLFHGWHHINFVRNKSLEFAKTIDADLFLVESAALTHDLNYVIEVNSNVDIANSYRNELLEACGYEDKEIIQIGNIIIEANTSTRWSDISLEAQALSDWDSLFKVLPITPIMFSSKYIQENNVDIYKLAHKIVTEQNKLLEQNIYFYTKSAKEKYLNWAITHLTLWNQIYNCLEDKDIIELMEISKDFWG